MRNKELFNEIKKLCEKYGFMEVKQNLQSLGCREFESENYLTIGESLSETINEIVSEKCEYEKWKIGFTLNEDNEDFEYPIFYEELIRKSIKENQMKVLNVIMDLG